MSARPVCRRRHIRTPHNDVLDGDTSSIVSLFASPGPDGVISLREALTAANNTPNVGGPDEIRFTIGGGGSQTIQLQSALPTITDSVVLDGTTQPEYAEPATVTIDGTGFVGSVLGITSDSNVLRGFAIRTPHIALVLSGSDGNVVSDLDLSWLGTEYTDYLTHGLRLYSSSSNLIERVKATNRGGAMMIDLGGGSSSANTIQLRSTISSPSAASCGRFRSARCRWTSRPVRRARSSPCRCRGPTPPTALTSSRSSPIPDSCSTRGMIGRRG